ncbi:MAG: (2Fe-2S) ferredoxin domain-containing protein, partial [Methanothrix sp.]|nr:(2Fe-2S) ferredoxin domain-containing protein [Methanothrix sp.]
MARLASIQDLEILREEIERKSEPKRKEVAICTGTGCLGLGARKVVSAFEKEIKIRGLQREISIKETGCPGFCEKGTVVVVYPPGIY